MDPFEFLEKIAFLLDNKPTNYPLMWEAGVLIGFLFENMWTEGHPDTIYWICIGICVVLLLMYEFFTHQMCIRDRC